MVISVDGEVERETRRKTLGVDERTRGWNLNNLEDIERGINGKRSVGHIKFKTEKEREKKNWTGSEGGGGL